MVDELDTAEEPAAAVSGRKRKTSDKCKSTKKVKKTKAKKPKKTKARRTTSTKAKQKKTANSEDQESKQTTRLLKIDEREELVKKIDKNDVVSHVYKVVPDGLVSHLFPERLLLWEQIKDSKEFKTFLLMSIDHFLILLEQNSKGKDKYAHLYLAWLDYIRTYTCRSQQTLSGVATMVLLQRSGISLSVQRTVVATILHSVQNAIQSRMATNIEALNDSDQRDLHVPAADADETALYRISGWALKSCIDITRKHLSPDNQQQLDLLIKLKRPKSDKEFLPEGVKFLDRGGLTFVYSWLLPWLNQAEVSIKVNLSQTGYARYGKDVFQITKDSIIKDSTLLCTFTHVMKH